MIIIICGMPSTGKTLLSKQLAPEIDAIHLDTDQIRKNLGLQAQYDEASKDKVYNHMLNEAGELLTQKRIVIAEGTFHLKKRRDQIRELAEKNNSPCFFVELKAMEDTLVERLKENHSLSKSGLDAYLKLKSEYEEIRGKKLIIWSDRNSMDDMVQKVKEYVYG